jgi:hypothetical protein
MQSMQVRRIFILCCTLAWSASYGYRLEFKATVNGERLSGGEICFYPGADLSQPVARLLGSNLVRCLPADAIIDMPEGIWNFYARHADGWISHHGSAVSAARADPEQGYRAIEVELVASATLDFRRVSDGDFAVFVPNADDPILAAAEFPLPRGTDTLEVPADHDLLIVRPRDGDPVHASEPFRLPVAAFVDAAAYLENIPSGQIIASVVIDSSADSYFEELGAPSVMFDSGDARWPPLFSLTTPGSARSALVFFSGLPDGTGRIEIEGTGWRRILTRPVEVGSTPMFIEAPLVLTPERILYVHVPWPSGRPPASRSGCSDDESDPIEWTVELRECPEWTDRGAGLPVCPGIAERILGSEDTVRFPVSGRGPYRVALIGGDVAVGDAEASFGDKTAIHAAIEFRRRVLSGIVTEGGVPVQAELVFGSTTTASDLTGAYDVVLPTDLGRDAIEVTSCDGTVSAFVIPKEPIVGSRRYDIEIPRNRVELTVFSDEGPLPDAAVGRGIFESRADAATAVIAPTPSGADAVTDAHGRAVFGRLPSDHFLRLCASAPGYATACAEPIPLTDRTDAQVDLELKAEETTRGRVEVAGSIIAGRLFRVAADGSVRDVVTVDTDGSFLFKKGGPRAHVVFVSRSHPLFAVPEPAESGEGEILVQPPAGALRSFTVALDPASMPDTSGFFDLAVGVMLIPRDALAAHLTLRGLSSYVSDDTAAKAVDVIASAPLIVTLQPRAHRDAPATGPLRPRYVAVIPPDGQLILNASHRID